MSTLMNKYKDEIRPKLQKELGCNLMAVPRIEKITLNMGVGKAATENKKIMGFAAADLTAIAGQKAQITKAKKSIAGFKIREGWPIGCMVTLRGKRMYDFLERFISIAAPRVRDFRGFKKKLDGRGNYSLGIREQIVFPEINFDKIDEIRGLNITVTTTANNDDDAKALLKAFNFPIKD